MASAIIYAAKTTTGGQPSVRRLPEAASKTFLQGVPVQLSGGNIEEWDGATVAGGIAGVSMEQAKNRTTAGTGQIVNPTGISVANQPNGVLIGWPPFDDGEINVASSERNTVFWGQITEGQTTSAAMVGSEYGLTKDADNHWYIDVAKVTPGVNTVVTVVGTDINDTRGVFFVFNPGASQII